MTDGVSRPDAQVTGLSRLFPTPLAKSLVVALPTASATVFWAVLNYVPHLFQDTPERVQLLVALVAATITGLLIALLLLEFIDIVNKRKHSTIYHDNYTSVSHVHVTYAVLLSVAMFILGFFAANP